MSFSSLFFLAIFFILPFLSLGGSIWVSCSIWAFSYDLKIGPLDLLEVDNNISSRAFSRFSEPPWCFFRRGSVTLLWEELWRSFFSVMNSFSTFEREHLFFYFLFLSMALSMLAILKSLQLDELFSEEMLWFRFLPKDLLVPADLSWYSVFWSVLVILRAKLNFLGVDFTSLRVSNGVILFLAPSWAANWPLVYGLVSSFLADLVELLRVLGEIFMRRSIDASFTATVALLSIASGSFSTVFSPSNADTVGLGPLLTVSGFSGVFKLLFSSFYWILFCSR